MWEALELAVIILIVMLCFDLPAYLLLRERGNRKDATPTQRIVPPEDERPGPSPE